MNTRFHIRLGLLLAGLYGAQAQAQTTATSTAEHDSSPAAGVGDASFVVEEVLVSARRQGLAQASDMLTSVDVAGPGLVEHANAGYAWELFGRMPGVMLTQFNQGTTSGKLSLRGFNGEGEVNAVKLLIDGVPSNSNDGNMPYIDSVMPLEIAALEVVRGTNDPRYGLYNIAGDANIVTRSGGSYQQVRGGYGGWGRYDLQAVSGYERGGFTQNYVLGYVDGDGYRHHSHSRKHSISGQWAYDFGGGQRLAFHARRYRAEAQEPGYLTDADAYANRRESYAFSASDGGERGIAQLSLHLDLQPSTQLSWSSLLYRNQLDDQRFVRFSAGVSQQERDTDETHYGARSGMTWRPDWGLLPQTLVEWGVDAEWQRNESERYSTAQRQRQTQTRDQHFAFNVYGAYAQASLRPLDWLKLVPAWRVDRVTGNFHNQLNDSRYPVNDYGLIQQPKISAVASLGQRANLYANYGRSYQVGIGSASYKIPPRTTDLKPSINNGVELGSKFVPASWLNGRIAIWRQTASDEVRRKLNDPLGDSENVGKTRRQGLDLQANVKALEQLSVWLAYAYQDSEILVPDPAAPATRGKQIDHVPHQLITGGVDYMPMPALSLSLELNTQSNYYLERTNNTGQYGELFNLNLGATYRPWPQLQLEAQVANLTNEHHEYVWWDGTQALHAPAATRAYYGAVKLSF
ncbi:iron complex outermembrane recepter protein [Solimonas aquatica]|uniref:Iron complex outermembrane recepter protein n=1 Tax=Solimonas aquatica TaxID=489703 RepID=A0A1H9A2Y2_9GAMM|nr:TonB-dependent receptor [Solimonas aquatica]SEP70368.1 iron complex outermembrane recepter protein [Solimonas aquatica]